MSDLAILGLGRAGLSFALALRGAGQEPALLWDRDSERARAVAALLERYVASGTPPAGLHGADCVLLAVPDRGVGELAAELADRGLARSGQAALHLAGALDRDVLAPLARCGVATGSLHPLRALPDPLRLPVDEAVRRSAAALRGATFGLEAEEGSPARRAAEQLVGALGGRPVLLRTGGKAAYHAAAVLASNALVALLHEAARLAGRGLCDPQDALGLLLDLAGGVLRDVADRGPAAALTGPIVRGDAQTVARHLEALQGDPAEPLYRALARSTVALAREAGTPDEALAPLEKLLR